MVIIYGGIQQDGLVLSIHRHTVNTTAKQSVEISFITLLIHAEPFFSIKEAERTNVDKKTLEENTTRKEEGRRLHQEIIRNKKKLNNSQALDRVIIFTA